MKRIIPFFIAAIMIITNLSCAYAAKSISDLNKEKNNIKNKAQEAKNDLAATQKEKSQVLAEVEKLDRELTAVQDELDRLNNKLEQTKQNLQKSQNDLVIATEKKDQQYVTLKKRIRVMYENGSVGYIQVILDSQNFSDFLKRVEYINRLMEYDRNVLSEYQNTEQMISDKVVEISEQKEEIEDLSDQQKAKKRTLDENIVLKNNLVKQLSSEEATYMQQIKDLEEADKDVTALINKAQKEAAARKAAQQAPKTTGASSNKVYKTAGGQFAYPVPAYGLHVNSPYGYRSSPISGKSEFHTGVDLKATMGTDIVAAEAGTVIFSGNKGGYGKCVIIDHGNGISTLYAHNSQLVVSVGQTVQRGQVVSKAGTTGYSTGVHLHFEVRINGKHTNPLPYISS